MSIKGKFITTSIILSFLLLVSCQLEPYSKGKEADEFYCASCHMKDGTGLAALIPPIAGADFYAENQHVVACIITKGFQDSIIVNGKKYGQKMDPISLTPIQITNIINYMNQSWGNNIPVKSIESVKEDLEKCPQ